MSVKPGQAQVVQRVHDWNPVVRQAEVRRVGGKEKRKWFEIASPVTTCSRQCGPPTTFSTAPVGSAAGADSDGHAAGSHSSGTDDEPRGGMGVPIQVAPPTRRLRTRLRWPPIGSSAPRRTRYRPRRRTSFQNWSGGVEQGQKPSNGFAHKQQGSGAELCRFL